MANQTAIDWLVSRINVTSYDKIPELIEQAKQMEKAQIIKAWDDGDYAYFYSKETGRDFENGEEYYNENYTDKT